MKTKDSVPYTNPTGISQLMKNVGFIRGSKWMQQQIEDKISGMITEIDAEYDVEDKEFDIADSDALKEEIASYLVELQAQKQILQKLLDEIKIIN